MRYHSEFFWRHSWDISVCQPVSQSLIYLPIGHFWGSTSETSGLVFSENTTREPGTDDNHSVNVDQSNKTKDNENKENSEEKYRAVQKDKFSFKEKSTRRFP